MKTTKIVIASILKPVNDVRMYKKFAKSLTQFSLIEVHIVGFRAASTSIEDKIFFHPIFNFSRLNFKRLLAPLKFFLMLFRLKPGIVIITTHELLISAVLFKLFNKCTLLYDVRENYYNNIRYTTVFPVFIRNLVAGYVRLKELITKSFIDHYFLAEQCYFNELKFAQGKYTIIENKYAGNLSGLTSRNYSERIQLLYSGTIADNYGIFEAVSIADRLYQIESKVRLTIIGFAARKEVLDKLMKVISDKEYIQLIGGDKLISHNQIVNAIEKAHFGFISYRPDKSTRDCIPTKLYEYLAHQLPVILFPNPLWESICNRYNAAITIDPASYSPEQLLHQLKNKKFYTTPVDESVLWKQEEQKLLNVIEKYMD